jgi:hypothetical protein
LGVLLQQRGVLGGCDAINGCRDFQLPSAKAEWPTMTKKRLATRPTKRRRKREKTGDKGKEKEDVTKGRREEAKEGVKGGEKSRKRTISTDRETTWLLKQAEDRGE